MKNIERFQKDLVDGIHNAYSSANIPFDVNDQDFNSVCLEYINMMNRLIGPRKRKVYLSKELLDKISSEDAESIRLNELVTDMKVKFENGEDVNGHLSKTIFKHNEDKFFDDWNITHLHLCLGKPDVFDFTRAQSGDLLMAIVLYDEVYFIDTTKHLPNDWYRIELLKIVKNNWEKELLIRHDEILSLSYDFKTTAEIKELRKSNVNSIIHEIDGKFYSVKNAFGYSSAGTSNKAMFCLMALKRFLDKLDFEYDHMTFNDFCVNCFCTIISADGKTCDIVRNIE